MLDARHPNSNTDELLESMTLKFLATQLARAESKHKPAIDLMYAYAHTTLDDETYKFNGFISDDKLFAFIKLCYDLKGPSVFFTQQLSVSFKDLIHQGSVLVCTDDTLIVSNLERHLLQLIQQLHDIAKEENPKIVPEKSFFTLLTVNYLCQEFGCNTFKPILSKATAIHKIPCPITKIELNMFIGSKNIYSKNIDELRVIMKPLYDLLRDSIMFHWNKELETLLQQIRTSITKDVILMLPTTSHPFFITVVFP